MFQTPLRRIPDYFLYGEPPHKYAERLLHVETIEARSSRYHWKIDPHLHRSLYQIVLVLRGRGIATAESAAAHFDSPALIFVPAGTVHGFKFEPGALGFVISLSEEPLAEAVRRESAVARLFTAPLTLELREDAPSSVGLVRAAQSLAREHAEAAHGCALALEGWLSVLLASVLRIPHWQSQSDDALLSRARELVARFQVHIEAGFRSSRSMPDYARALHVSETRLRSACLAVTGRSPIQLVHARVLIEAKRQLRYTTLGIAEIGYGLRFDDPAYFTRFFTSRVGVSPRAYRLQGLKTQAGTQTAS
ncbi:MAG TPA: helix-turn-helix domain-containing protein [Steroidobacteraceae bacterium]|nr:helix-turn-helix domain-containing protein [Steroidobacteraceae bacterium]